MEEGLPGLPQLVQEAGQLKMQLTKVLVNELGSGSATDEQRPALLLEEFYGQVSGLRADLDRLAFIYQANQRDSAQRTALMAARKAVDRLAFALISQSKIRGEFTGLGGEPQEAARMWESVHQAIMELEQH
ncbi:hypothetical protein IV102_24615 [bacterium]|nr:hypothetical protein [bacterium]